MQKIFTNYQCFCEVMDFRAIPCACCAGGVGKVQRFQDVLQQCAC